MIVRMTTRRTIIVIACAVLAFTSAIVYLILRDSVEPVYERKRASEWLAVIEEAEKTHDPSTWDDAEKAKSALRTMGTKVLPYLLSEIRAGSTIHDRFVNWLGAHSFHVGPDLPPNSERWVRAIRGLQVMGPIGMPYLSELVEVATNNVGYGSAALVSLGGGAIPAVTNLLAHTSFPVTGNLVGALVNEIFAERIRPEDAEIAVGSILRVFQGTDTHARTYAAAALGAIHLQPKLCVPVLIAAISDPNPGIPEAAIQAVGAFGEAAAEHTPLLIAQFDRGDAGVRRSLCTAIGRLAANNSNAVSVLVRAASDNDHTVRMSAAIGLGACGSHPAQCIPALLGAMKDENGVVRTMAVQSLGSFKSSAKTIIPVVEKAVMIDPDAQFRRIAETTIMRLRGEINW